MCYLITPHWQISKYNSVMSCLQMTTSPAVSEPFSAGSPFVKVDVLVMSWHCETLYLEQNCNTFASTEDRTFRYVIGRTQHWQNSGSLKAYHKHNKPADHFRGPLQLSTRAGAGISPYITPMHRNGHGILHIQARRLDINHNYYTSTLARSRIWSQ
jgi:hypothetical protein